MVQFYTGREFPSKDGRRVLVIDNPEDIAKCLKEELQITGVENLETINRKIGKYFSGSPNELYKKGHGRLNLSDAVKQRKGICKEQVVALGVLLESFGYDAQYISGSLRVSDEECEKCGIGCGLNISYCGEDGRKLKRDRHAFLKLGEISIDPNLESIGKADWYAEALSFRQNDKHNI